MPKPPNYSTRAALSRFDDHLRRISTALYGAGMLAVLLVANTGLVRTQAMNRAALNWRRDVAASVVALCGSSRGISHS